MTESTQQGRNLEQNPRILQDAIILYERNQRLQGMKIIIDYLNDCSSEDCLQQYINVAFYTIATKLTVQALKEYVEPLDIEIHIPQAYKDSTVLNAMQERALNLPHDFSLKHKLYIIFAQLVNDWLTNNAEVWQPGCTRAQTGESSVINSVNHRKTLFLEAFKRILFRGESIGEAPDLNSEVYPQKDDNLIQLTKKVTTFLDEQYKKIVECANANNS